jgi:hypothetical protein
MTGRETSAHGVQSNHRAMIVAAGTVWRHPVFGRVTRKADTMIALVSDERVQQLANECIELSKRTDDAVASELLKLSNRVLQLATPTLPAWKKFPENTCWRPRGLW